MTTKKLIKKIISRIITIIAVCGLVYSSYNLYTMYNTYNEGKKEYTNITQNYTIEPIEKNKNPKYPKFKNINFHKLKKINKDIVAWISIPNTVVDYPVVHSKDNSDYLHRNIYGQYLYAGTIFIDANNNDDFSDKNTIIYGHNMKDGSMFAMLNKYTTDPKYYNKHKYIQIYTKESKMNYCIIGYEIVQENSNHYELNFIDDNDYQKWLKEVTGNPSDKVNKADPDKNIITLSTCHGPAGGSQRLILHLQKISSVSNYVYDQFWIDNENKGGQNNGIVCYCSWIKHRDF